MRATSTQTPTAKALATVRECNRKNLAINALLRSPAEAEFRRRSFGFEPPAPLRSATEAEMREIALALDAGEPINPRLWLERFTVHAQRVAA